MTPFVSTYNTISAVGAIIMAVLAVALFVAVLVDRKSAFVKFVAKNTLKLGFVISLIGVAGSLIYSNVIGYPPCMLCWYARIFLYPQFILYGLALRYKDELVVRYTKFLTILGLIFATYHYIIEMTGYAPVPCSAGGVSCLTRYVFEFGFVSIPFMVLSMFALLGAILFAKSKVIHTQQ